MEEKKEKIKKRKGLTNITSVSISDEIRKILDEYKFSPSDVFRKGIGVSLFEVGNTRYNTPLNRERYEALNYKLKLDRLENSLYMIKENVSLIIDEIQKIKDA